MQVVTLILVGAASALAEAPYPPSGWKPSGPRLQLPEKQSAPKDSYYPQSDDQISREYGTPDLSVQRLPSADQTLTWTQGSQVNPAGQQFRESNKNVASAQGLPVEEPSPLFIVTPISGQQYLGASFNADLKALQRQLADIEVERQRNFERQFKSQVDEDEYDVGIQKTPNYKQSDFAPKDYSPRVNQFDSQNDFNGFKNETSNNDTNNTFKNDNNNKYTNDKTVDSQKSNGYKLSEMVILPQSYPNQLAQLAIQQDAAAFSQQIGQLHLPIIYQPAQAQRLSQPLFGQIFNDANANFAPIDYNLARQTVVNNDASKPEDRARNETKVNSDDKETKNVDVQNTQSYSRQRFYPGAEGNGQNVQQNSFKEENDYKNNSDDNDFKPTTRNSGFNDRIPQADFTRYGAPEPRTRGEKADDSTQGTFYTNQQANQAEITPDSEQKSTNESRRRKSSRIRSLIPLFTLDKDGNLVQLQ